MTLEASLLPHPTSETRVDRPADYFDVLPLHPQPRTHAMESLTGWLVRLAEVNGIQSRHALTRLCLSDLRPYALYGVSADSLPASIGALSMTTVCQEQTILATTFYYLPAKFWRVSPLASGRFLQGSLAPHLRYCPLCLSSADPSYFLLWRFRMMPGCAEHRYRLLNCCTQCGAAIPVFAAPFRFGVCPSCQRPLSACAVTPLSDDEYATTLRRSRDLLFLLSPHPDEFDARIALTAIGLEYTRRREWQHRTVRDVALALGMEEGTVRSMENVYGLEEGTTRRVGAKFHHYALYADALGVTLHELFAHAARHVGLDRQARWARKHGERERREDALVARVEWVIECVRDRGGLVTQQAVCDEVGLTHKALKGYRRVKDILASIVAEGSDHDLIRRRREADVLHRVRNAVTLLVARKQRVTQKAVGEIIGMTGSNLKHYPDALTIIRASREVAAVASSGDVIPRDAPTSS